MAQTHVDTPRDGGSKVPFGGGSAEVKMSPAPPPNPSPSKAGGAGGGRGRRMSVTGKERVGGKGMAGMGAGLGPVSPRSPRRGSIMIDQMLLRKKEKEAEDMEKMANAAEMLHASNGKAVKMFDACKNTMQQFEREVLGNIKKKAKKDEEQAKLVEELQSIDAQILNLQPRYKMCCEAIVAKEREVVLLQRALNSAKSKTGMLLDLQHVEGQISMQQEMSLLKRQALLALGKDPGKMKPSSRAGKGGISSSLGNRKKGLLSVGPVTLPPGIAGAST